MRIQFLLLYAIVLMQPLYSQTTSSLKVKSKEAKIRFLENQGQVSDQLGNLRPDVLFSGTDGQLSFFVRNNGLSYQLKRVDSYREEYDNKFRTIKKYEDKVSVYRVDGTWKNCRSDFKVKTDAELPGFNNYYLESCARGVNNVKSFSGVWLKDVYKGIDVHYYEKEGELKCDYLVRALADYMQIQIQMAGAEVSVLENGNLLFKTPLGNIEEDAPLVFQNGVKLKAHWSVKDNVLGFIVPGANKNLPLLIDPATRMWGTYMGGTNDDAALFCVTDALGNVYFSGETQSAGATIIATTGSHQVNLVSGKDAFLQKFDANGLRLWSTYYGASSNEEGNSCATDLAGNIYLAGSTFNAFGGTNTLIATPGSHQASGGGSTDAFLAKFNGSGQRLWATYYGGNGIDRGYGVSTDPSGNVFLAGTTSSTNSINYFGYSTSIIGPTDAFLVKFNSAGVRQWGTYYGGIDLEEGFTCSADVSGNIYLGGYTFSANNNMCCINPIASPGSHQYNKSGGDDGFLVKFSSTGSRLWGTFYGGASDDYVFSCFAYSNTVVYVAGWTSSAAAGIVAGAQTYQSAPGGGTTDGFVGQLNAAGVRQWGTFYGGTGADYVANCTTDPSGNVFITGNTTSSVSAKIATPGSHQFTYGGGSDAFLAKLSPQGPRQWGTYYGGTGADNGNGCAADGSGNVYMVGASASTLASVISTNGSHQVNQAGLTDAFLVKFGTCITTLTAASTPSTICYGVSTTLTATGADTYTWQPGGTVATSVVITPTNSAVNYTLLGAALSCQSATAAIALSINPLPQISAGSGTTCLGTSFTISPSGAQTYSYSGGNAIVTPAATSVYTITGTDATGCTSNPGAIITVSVIAPQISVNSGNICPGQSFTLVPSGAVSYSFSPSGPIVSPNVTTFYSVTGTDLSGCTNSVGVVSTVVVDLVPTIAVSSGSICIGSSFNIQPSGAATYTITGGASVVSPTVNSTYTVTGTGSNGCVNLTGAVSSVDVKPLPIITASALPSQLCVGESATISASGASTYNWLNSGLGNNLVVYPTANSTYTVIGTSNGCSTTTFVMLGVSGCVGLSEQGIEESEIVILPNPTSGKISLKLEAGSNLSFRLYDILGSLLLEGRTIESAADIDLEPFSGGVYFIHIDSGKPVIKKIVKD